MRTVADEAIDIREARIADLEQKLSTALVISQNYQSLMVTAERERGEARQERDAIALAKLPEEWPWALSAAEEIAKLTSERDEARSSLARVVEALEQIVQFAAEGRNLAVPLEQARLLSALHRSQGE